MKLIIFYTPKISSKIPVIILIKYKILTIFIFSLVFLFDLNKTSSATPLPAKSPAKADENGKISAIYNSVNIMLEPQFGIRPTNPAINGEKIVVLSKICLILSSPI